MKNYELEYEHMKGLEMQNRASQMQSVFRKSIPLASQIETRLSKKMIFFSN